MYAEIERAKNRIPLFAIGKKNGKIVAIGIFSIRPLLFANMCSAEAICLRGPAFDDIGYGREYLLQVIKYFKYLYVGSLRISPSWYFPEAESVESLLKEINFNSYDQSTRSATGIIDLQRSKEEIYSSFHQKHRQKINLAKRMGIRICPATSFEEASIAFRCLKTMRSERGIIPMSSEEFNATYQYILKDQELGIILNAYADSTFLGTIWGFFGPQIMNPSGYAVDAEACKKVSSALTIGPDLFLQMCIIAKDRGCIGFDTEGPAVDPKDPIQHFKMRFNPTKVEKISQHIYTCNNVIKSLEKVNTKIGKIERIIESLPYRLKKELSTYKAKV
jgi:hypothetical protein